MVLINVSQIYTFNSYALTDVFKVITSCRISNKDNCNSYDITTMP